MSLRCCDCGSPIFRNGAKGRNPSRCQKCRRAFRSASSRARGVQAKHERVCRQCKKSFLCSRARQPFCSYDCMHLSQRKRITLVCENKRCSKEFEVTPSQLANGRRHCCMECSHSPPLVCQNPKCGRTFRMKRPTKDLWKNKGKYCCPECYRDHRWGDHRPKRKRSKRHCKTASSRALASSLRQRCKKFVVTFDPACTRDAVLARDGWVCQKCGVTCNKEYKLDPATKTPDLRNAEHDHIIPLSALGSPGNVFENSQCLCKRCNLAKRDKSEGQLRLRLEEESWGKGVRVRSLQSSRSSEAIQATAQ